MLVTKLLEGTLTAGQTSITFTDTDIPNSFVRVGSSDPDVYPTEQTISGTTLTLKYEAQASALYIIVELVKASMEIEDSLTSDDADTALSAKQGKVLKNLIDGFSVPSMEDLTDVNVSELSTDDILIYDGTEEEWINTAMPNIPSDIDDLDDVSISSPENDEVLTFDDGEWVNKAISVTGGIDYSTSEQDTGIKWIDGKNIYQKTYSFENVVIVVANQYSNIVTDASLNASTIIKGFSSASDLATFTPTSITYVSDVLQAYYTSAWSIKYFTVYYTKNS